jgi:hypothetical protein
MRAKGRPDSISADGPLNAAEACLDWRVEEDVPNLSSRRRPGPINTAVGYVFQHFSTIVFMGPGLRRGDSEAPKPTQEGRRSGQKHRPNAPHRRVQRGSLFTRRWHGHPHHLPDPLIEGNYISSSASASGEAIMASAMRPTLPLIAFSMVLAISGFSVRKRLAFSRP